MLQNRNLLREVYAESSETTQIYIYHSIVTEQCENLNVRIVVLQVARALWAWFRPAAVTAAASYVYTAGRRGVCVVRRYYCAMPECSLWQRDRERRKLLSLCKIRLVHASAIARSQIGLCARPMPMVRHLE